MVSIVLLLWIGRLHSRNASIARATEKVSEAIQYRGETHCYTFDTVPIKRCVEKERHKLMDVHGDA